MRPGGITAAQYCQRKDQLLDSAAKVFDEDAIHPSVLDERCGTDLMFERMAEHPCHLTMFLDEYSRYVVHWELLTSKDGASVGLAQQGRRIPIGFVIPNERRNGTKIVI